MEDLLNAIPALLGKINPLFGVAALAVLWLFGDKIKALLAKIKLPKLSPTPTPADPKTELDAWLEAHPLLDRVWKRAKELFSDQVANGKLSEDDAYVKIVDALKKAFEQKQ